jgi:hypothetical protein
VMLAVIAGSLVALRINLQPWETAAEVVWVMRDAVHRGEDPRLAIQQWESMRRVGLRLGPTGVPVEYKGVNILLNGYPEFVAAAGEGGR